MSIRTVTLTLPEALYERAREASQAVDRPLEQVLAQSIALALPALETNLPPAIRAELSALPLLSDAELQAIAHSTMDQAQQTRLEALTETQKHRSLSPQEQSELNQLLEKAEQVMLRKAEAYRLLARRGHTVFSSTDSLTD